MPEEKLILGSGGGGKGGGGGGRTPTEQDDSLSSEQFASVLDLLCEGEIQGFDDGGKSIFLEDTPLQMPQLMERKVNHTFLILQVAFKQRVP